MKAKERVENMIDELHSLQEVNKQLKKALAGTGHQPVPLTDLIDYNIDVPHRFQNALRQIASSSSTCAEPHVFVCSDRSEQRLIVHVSQAFALLSGYQVHEMIGKKADEVLHNIAVRRQSYQLRNSRNLATKLRFPHYIIQDHEGQATIVRKDNSTVRVDVQEARMSDAVGRHFLSLYACEPLHEV
jgi:PAS domain-containing protein